MALYEVEVHPNPTAASLTVFVSAPNDGALSIRVFDTAGRLVRTLTDRPSGVVDRRVSWDGRDELGQRVGQGIYFVRVSFDGFVLDRRVVLLPND